MDKDNRKILNSGYYLYRFVTVPFILFFLIGYVKNTNNWLYLVLLVLFIILYVVFLRSRRLAYDTDFLYMNKFTGETIIPFVDIISIDRSKTKIDGRKFWILTYQTKTEGIQELRYFKSFNFKQFHEAIIKQNPKVEIWKPNFIK